MRIYESKDYLKREVHCRLCGRTGHMWFKCQMPTKFLEALENNEEPDWSLMSVWSAKHWRQLDSNGELERKDQLMANCAVWKLQQEKRNEKMHARRNARASAGTKKRKCGFCGETDHNRRNCSVLKDFQKDLERANQNYRKMFYSTMVEGYGLAEGALVQLKAKYVQMNGSWQEDWEGIGLITGIDWDKVNLGLTARGWSFRSQICFQFVIEGENYNSDTPFKLFCETDNKVSNLFSSLVVNDWGINIESVLSPSETIPSQEWFEETNSDCYNYVLKKLKMESLGELVGMIEKFHPSRVGRGAKALQERIENYKQYCGGVR